MVPSSKGKNLLPDSVHQQNQFPSSEASTVLSFGEIVYVYTGKYIHILLYTNERILYPALHLAFFHLAI